MKTASLISIFRCVRNSKALQAMSLALGLLLFCLPAFSQLNLGSIAGTVTDSSGAVISGATVTVTDTQRGVSRTLTTDTSGAYSAPSLTPGTYEVSASFQGFQTLNHTGVTVGVAQAVRVDMSLQPGTQAQSVTVTEAVPLINVSNEVLSSTVENTQLSQLPLNGHLYTKILDFQPGVHGNPGGNSPNYQTNGAGGQGNYFMLDGVENTNVFVNSGPLIGAATSTDELTILPQDAVEEVNVMTNPPAEYGWFQGAVVNVGLKSGTNSPHGDAYFDARNNNLDAYDPYLRQNGVAVVPKQTDDFKQFGGSFGGPIKKDKLFFFGAFDGMRYTVGSGAFSNLATVNGGAVDNPALSVPLAIDGLIAHGVTPSPLSLALADCTVTGGAASCGNKGVFPSNSLITQAVPVPGTSAGHSNNVLGRVDYHLNNTNSINGEYFFGQAVTSTPNVGEPAFWNNLNLSRTQMMRAVWINTPSSNWVNDVRFGYNRYNLEDGNAECVNGNYSTGNVGQPDYAKLGFISGATPPSPFCGFPAISFNGTTGLPPMGALSFFISDQGVFQYTYTAYDNASYTHGNHNLKFGFEFHHSHFHGIGAPGYLDGAINFDGGGAFSNPADPTCAVPTDCSTDLQDFLAGAVGANNQILVNPQQEDTSLGFNREALYFEDNFRINSRLTADLGLRYELEPAILVDNNAAGNFDPSSPTGMVQQAGSPLYNPDHHDFSPRAGIAWDMTGKGTTVLRAGMGVSYDTPQIDDLVATGFGAGLNAIPTGFNLFNDTGLAVPASTNPQAVRTAVLTVPGSALSWAVGTPVFPATLDSDLACGTGNSGVTLSDGASPGPCTLKARGTVVKGPNGTLSMTRDNARSPMYTWTLGIQHAFKANTSLTVNYVGTHTDNLASEININQPTPGLTGSPVGGTDPTNPGTLQVRQPYYNQFPWFDGIFVYGPAGFSNYNALQVTFVQRNFHGLTMNAAYTFSRDLATPKGGNNPYIFNADCVACSYGLQTPTQDLGITLVYDLPGLNAPAQLLKGWEISSAINIQSGQPFAAEDSRNDFAGVGDATALFGGASEPWSIYGGSGRNFNNLGKFASDCEGAACHNGTTIPQACISAASAEPVNASTGLTGLDSLNQVGYCFISPNGKSVIIPPSQGTFGNMRPGTLISAPFHEWDLTVHKKFNVTERFGLDFSISAFNVLNSTNYALGFTGGTVTIPSLFGQSSQDPNNGNPINGTGGPREVLLGLKASF